MNKSVRYSHSGGLCDRDMGMGFPPQDVISVLGFICCEFDYCMYVNTNLCLDVS